jgi:allophanate hydrolase subunit 1
VAIAGAQAGIYPLPSPGGWQIIGRTPAALCDLRPAAPVPFLLQPGDRVRFDAVDEEEFARLVADGGMGVGDGA